MYAVVEEPIFERQVNNYVDDMSEREVIPSDQFVRDMKWMGKRLSSENRANDS